MSVTISIEGNTTGAFIAECHETNEVIKADTYDGILLALTAHKMTCEECEHYGIYSEAVLDVPTDLDVNMANANAALVLGRLGFGVNEYGETCGSADGETFLGAVLLAIAADGDDTGVAPVATRALSGRSIDSADDVAGEGEGAIFVDCGVRSGYFAVIFTRLHALATEAVRLGRTIQWC